MFLTDKGYKGIKKMSDIFKSFETKINKETRQIDISFTVDKEKVLLNILQGYYDDIFMNYSIVECPTILHAMMIKYDGFLFK